MQARLKAMEEEMATLRSMQAKASDDGPAMEGDADPNAHEGSAPPSNNGASGEGQAMETDDPADVVDARSVYVGNVCTDSSYTLSES